MKFCLLALLTACCCSSFSQTVVNVDKADGLPLNAYYTVSGNPFVNYRFVRLVEGSPYFNDMWMPGLVLTDEGKAYKASRVKLDLLGNQLIFLNEKGEEFVCTINLKEISLSDSATSQNFHFVYSPFVPSLAGEKKGWCQQLVNGKVSLFAVHVKQVQEQKPYGSSVAEQRIYTWQEYLVVYNGSILKVKKPKELPSVLADGKAELEAYLKKDEIKNLPVIDQMAALVKHYNSLQ